ncbi:winged helix-turn-helix transcriptional regulator [Elizabethkingia miricola]|uniref:winged helix-turn-helix transcriptional regulator n=1 Tax=Elizabethkingia bruuniana TaxID=1756149 RepID=UPI000999B6D7|nr:winged helix-turn-helix transcriptional regulator [Elizabethkingia bruuniana]OPC66345.1 hypothetical protein BAY13_16540 [Elizabethkingia bruuniana]RBI91657.1 winged helix-turn-helix transcriptional regulator [Elizabethkingia miricola]
MKATSLISHELIKPHKDSLQDKIYQGLLKIKRGSFREIAKASGLEEGQVWKRLSEMVRKNLIRDTGEMKLCEVSNRPVIIWEIIE